MKKFWICILFTLACLQPALAHDHGSHEAEKKAIAAAGTWLDLMDKGAYGLSWTGAGQVFKSAVTPEQWEKTAADVRVPLGKVKNRKLNHHKLSTTMAGMPDGLYVTLRYMTGFENKAHAVESLTLVKEDDGVFRVIGYFIK